MRTLPRSAPIAVLLVLTAIGLGGCESLRAVDQAGMLGTSLLAAVVGIAVMCAYAMITRSV
ncbi:MAG: hypothetical protein WKG00_24095 [Polyangiaceae bacterium]